MALNLAKYLAPLRWGAALATKKATATGAGGAVTINEVAGRITTEALTTAGAAEISYTVTNSKVAAGDTVLCTVGNGTNSTTPGPSLCGVTPAAGSFVVTIGNVNASALNGTLIIDFLVVKPA